MMLGNNGNEQQQQLENGSSGMNVEGGGGGGGEGGVQLKKGPWTAAEDTILTEYVRKHGEGNWNAVQRNTGLARCGKSCRLRWANHLRPNLKKGAFSPEEERLIVELHAQLGNKWARMAAQLPGRTDNEIKNYWNTRVKRRHRQGLPLYPPDIQPLHKHQQLSHPQSSQSHHSYHSTPSTPTTPNSASFSFHTTPNTPTATHHHHHSYHHHAYPPPCYSRSRSQTPNSLPPTPPQLSPSLQSPTFPTLSLFDSTNGHHPNHPNSNANMNNPFNMPRTPPILQNPIRFKRFHPDSNNINNISNNNPSNNNQNMENSHNNMNMNYQNNNFSLPFSPQFLRSSSSPMLIPQSPNSNNNNNNNNNNPFSNNSKLLSLPSFSSLPVNFNAQNSSMFRGPIEKDGFLINGSGNFSLKPELPSSQALSQQNGNCEMNFDNEKLSVSSSGSGLLEDLLEEAQAMASNYGDSSRRLSGVGSNIEDQNKREFGGFNQWSDSNSLNLSSGMKPKEENERGQMNTMHEDLSKLLNVIPSMQVPEWYNDSAEASNCQSSVVTDDTIGLEMQQIASLFRVDSNTGHVSKSQGSCPFDNFPGIC